MDLSDFYFELPKYTKMRYSLHHKTVCVAFRDLKWRNFKLQRRMLSVIDFTLFISFFLLRKCPYLPDYVVAVCS